MRARQRALRPRLTADGCHRAFDRAHRTRRLGRRRAGDVPRGAGGGPGRRTEPVCRPGARLGRHAARGHRLRRRLQRRDAAADAHAGRGDGRPHAAELPLRARRHALRPGRRARLPPCAQRCRRRVSARHTLRRQGHGFVCGVPSGRQRGHSTRPAGCDAPPADRRRRAGRGAAEDLCRPHGGRDRAQPCRPGLSRGRAGRVRHARRFGLRRAGAPARRRPARRGGLHLAPGERRTAGAAHAGDAVRPADAAGHELSGPGHAVRARAGPAFPRLPRSAARALPRRHRCAIRGHRQLCRLPAARPGRQRAGHHRHRLAFAAAARGAHRIGAADLRGARRGRDRAAARHRGAAPLGSQLPHHLRDCRRRDLHPRLGQRQDHRCQPEGLHDLWLHTRRADTAVGHRPRRQRASPHHRAGTAQPAAGPHGALPALRVAQPQQGWQPALGRGTAEGGADRRAPPHPGLHARDHRAQGGAGRAAGQRAAIPGAVRQQCGRDGAVGRRAAPGGRESGVHAHQRLDARRRGRPTSRRARRRARSGTAQRADARCAHRYRGTHRDAGTVEGRAALRGRGALRPGALRRRELRAVGGARHHRTKCCPGRAAHARGAVPRRLRRQQRRHGAVEPRRAHRRRQPGLRARLRLPARGGAGAGLRLTHTRRGHRRARGADPPGAGRAARPARDPGRAQGRPRLRCRAALPADPLRRRAACAVRGPRHHRAPPRRAGAARQRGAVPRDLQRLGRRPGAARCRFPHRRRQRHLRAHERHAACRGAGPGPRHCQPDRGGAAHPRVAPARAGRRDRRAGGALPAPRRHALPDRAARRADPPPRPAARAVHRPRHHRAQALRAGIARQRRAVPRDLQRVRRRLAAARCRAQRGRGQPGLPGAQRLQPRRGAGRHPRADAERRAAAARVPPAARAGAGR